MDSSLHTPRSVRDRVRRVAVRRSRIAGALPLALLALAFAGCAPGAGSGPVPTSPAATAEAADPAARPVARELALATFDSAWSRIHHSYYDPDFRGMDWGAVRDELRPRAADAETVGELRGVISEMLARLGESHFALLPREQVDGLEGDGDEGPDEADVGVDLRWVEGDLTVVRVHPGSAARTGVGTGWVVEAIGDQEVEEWRESLEAAEDEAARRGLVTATLSAATARLRGPAGTEVHVRFRDGRDRVVERTLEREPVPGQKIQLGNLPPFFAHLEHERVEVGDGGCVGVIRFNVWMLPLVAEFNRAVDELDGCRGIVVDVRGNPGGVGGMVMSTAGSFFDERQDLGVMTTRQGELRFVAMPRRVSSGGTLREPFEGRLAVLVDEQSMSTSEIFAAGLRATGRARIFGRATPGYALPAHMLRLPNQDVLYHAIANLTDPDGRRIEGEGVAPDVPVQLTRADLLSGHDRTLEAAVEWAGAAPATPPMERP